MRTSHESYEYDPSAPRCPHRPISHTNIIQVRLTRNSRSMRCKLQGGFNFGADPDLHGTVQYCTARTLARGFPTTSTEKSFTELHIAIAPFSTQPQSASQERSSKQPAWRSRGYGRYSSKLRATMSCRGSITRSSAEYADTQQQMQQ
jgi:hypothetical protein